MAKGKQGRAAKAARYRAATGDASQLARGRHQNQNQNTLSHFLTRAPTNHGFSLADEARNTADNHAGSNSLGKLRSLPVTFVSAGIVQPLDDLEDLDGSHEEREPADCLDPPTENPTQEQPLFFIDTAGDHALSRNDHQPVRIRSPSPVLSKASDSSEDVVLFKGRKGPQQRESRPAVVDHINIQVRTVEETMERITLQPAQGAGTCSPAPPSPRPWQFRVHNSEDEILADYIANAVNSDHEGEDEDEQGNQGSRSAHQSLFSARDLGGSDGDVVIAAESRGHSSSAGEDGTEDEEDDEESEGPGSGNPEMPAAEEDAVPGAEYMDDEVLARLLAKHEELGLDADDLALDFENGFEVMPSSSSRGSARRRGRSAANLGKSQKNARGYIPSAGAVADVFDELDLMDWDRLNPPRKPKSKRGQPNFDHLDPEMAATLEATWQKDRLRKKERKQMREDLRAQGLLRKNADPEDMRVKYPAGMTMDQIKEEMRGFLQGTDALLAFPPMDSNARKTVHELALKFNIKSKSTGNADQRRPVLHRTGRTVKYRHIHFEDVFNRRGRTYFHRMDVKRGGPGGGGGSGRPNHGRGVNHAAFSYKDGEVVGGSAPELSQANKGRNMLEKMGWSTGMALGATDNKGILQPVAHVVKRTKAGLG